MVAQMRANSELRALCFDAELEATWTPAILTAEASASFDSQRVQVVGVRAVLVSRQFVDMNRIRVEGLLAAFPKLVGSGSQHTYVETENVRYVYQPLEGMYLLLITNKQSNILEDLETVRLLAKVIPEYVQQPVEEQAVVHAAFELLFAFDEVISLGHREEVTVAQVRHRERYKVHCSGRR